MIEEGGVRQMRLARVGDVVLLDHPADAPGSRSIDCYLVKMLDFTAAASGGADAKRLKVGPDRLLYSLRWKHNATPADLHLAPYPRSRVARKVVGSRPMDQKEEDRILQRVVAFDRPLHLAYEVASRSIPFCLV